MDRSGLRVTVVGASGLGCDIALGAQRAGYKVTLVDEHPQTMGQMSNDAPWFYGTGLPTALGNENAVAQTVLGGAPRLAACFEAGVDMRVGTVAWGAFQNGPNSQSIGAPKLGLVDAGGNTMLEHDVLILATGTRDFVPAFEASDLPGIFGVKAGLAFLDLYQCYAWQRTLVLGTSAPAVDFVRRALARGVQIVGMVEPGQVFAAGPAARAEMAALGVPVLFGQVILAAEGEGGPAVRAARLRATGDRGQTSLPCDSICIALCVLPNIELPAAMGCRLRFDEGIASWLPQTDAAGRTSLPGVFWLSGFAAADPAATLAALPSPLDCGPWVLPRPSDQGRYTRLWVASLIDAGGGSVTLCKCEAVTRDDYLGLRPPACLPTGKRHAHTAVTGCGGGPAIQQDLAKRMTRAGMGHCQGKRCRDEAALLLSLRLGIDLSDIQPGSYRFPVRPLDLRQIAAPEPDGMRWSYWLHEPEAAAEA